MTYCANCGSPVEGRFCPKCGAAAPVATGAGVPPPTGGTGYVPPGPSPGSPSGYPPGPSGYPPPAASLGMDENLASALCYIPIVGLIFLLIEPYNKNKTIRFHAFQSIFYCIAWIILGIGLGIFFMIMFTFLPFGLRHIFGLISNLVQLALFVGWIFMVVKAYQRDRFVMPIIGPLAQKQA